MAVQKGNQTKIEKETENEKKTEMSPDPETPASGAKVIPFRWKSAWKRPLKVDEESFDPFTVARMTDHNVRGIDEELKKKQK